MPQFDSAHFISQIFWLFLSFAGLYLGIRFIVFPLFNAIFKMRQERIQGVLTTAEKLTQETQLLEEKIKVQKQAFEKKSVERFNAFQQQQIQEYQEELAKTEKRLLTSLQKKIQTMEHEEKKVLANAADFVLKAQKGEQ